MKTCYFLLLVTLGFAHTVQANDFEAELSSETAQFTFRSDSSLIGWGGAELGFGLYYNDRSDFIGQLEILQMGRASRQNPLTLGVGVRGYAGQIEANGEDIFALAIGGKIQYTFAGLTPMSLYARGFLAPKITSFADTETVKDYGVGFQVEILPQTTFFVGIHYVEVDTTTLQNYELDADELHLGVRIIF